jgi:hypothetical protein
MLLTITATHQPAHDLGYLQHATLGPPTQMAVFRRADADRRIAAETPVESCEPS